MAKRIVWVGVDGFGAQWIPWDVMPNLTKLKGEGLFAVGRDCFPTSSGINWATAMFGTVVEIHGYRNWNSKKPDVPAFEVTDRGIPPCIFHEIKRQDPSAYTVSVYNWDGIGFVHATNEIDYVRYFSEGSLERRDDDALAACLEQLKEHQSKLTFLYQHLPDCYGHKSGWGSPEFTNACIHVDQNLGKLVKGLEVLLKPAPDGTGLIVGGGMRPLLEAAGVRDAVGKSLGSKNRLNVVKATVDALNQLRSADEIAAARA